MKRRLLVKAKFDGYNLLTDELNNPVDDMFLFYKGNLTIEITSRNKQVFKVTLYLDIINPQEAEEFIQGYCRPEYIFFKSRQIIL